MKKIKTALISVFNKDGLDVILEKLDLLGVKFISTGGTYNYIKSLGYEATTVESLTTYPSILGGRVKTLHPKVFGGILARADNESDNNQLAEYDIIPIDLVIVDLYPFEETVKTTNDSGEIIEKIDIGGISLIRAAAKNFNDVLVVSTSALYSNLLTLLETNNGQSTIDDRKYYAAQAFNVSSHYDTAIFNWMNDGTISSFKLSINNSNELRYGENPHQKGVFYGDLNGVFEQIHGKAISYNNLLDLDAAISLINDFNDTTFAIIKHNNACGLASRNNLTDAWRDALAGDPVSAFGGVLITNRNIDIATATEINKIFFEIIIAPSYDDDALAILKSKKNRVILILKQTEFATKQFRSLLGGALNKQLIGSGTGQTSRVDALNQAIEKTKNFNLASDGAVMASDAFFPFADSVEIANNAGIKSVIQPGGSIRDKESIDYCNEHNMSMVLTGVRHFKH